VQRPADFVDPFGISVVVRAGPIVEKDDVDRCRGTETSEKGSRSTVVVSVTVAVSEKILPKMSQRLPGIVVQSQILSKGRVPELRGILRGMVSNTMQMRAELFFWCHLILRAGQPVLNILLHRHPEYVSGKGLAVI